MIKKKPVSPNEKHTVENVEELIIGNIFEVHDENTNTWFVGILLAIYNDLSHPSIVLNFMLPDGTTTQVDTAYAYVYTTPNFNPKHFCRTLERHRYLLQERLKLIERGISYTKARKNPIVVHVRNSTNTTIEKADYVGWLSTDRKKLMLPYRHQVESWVELTWTAADIETIGDRLYINDGTTNGSVFAPKLPFIPTPNNGSNIDRVQEEMNAICDADHSFPPDVEKIVLINDNAQTKASPVEEEAEPTEIVDAAVDELLWFNMGWQPSNSVSKYKPMYLIGTRWLRKGEHLDEWIFVANRGGQFNLITIPMTKPITYDAIEEACLLAGSKITDLVTSGDLKYIDSVTQRWLDTFKQQFVTKFGVPNNHALELINFAPIRIIPTRMPTPV